MEAVNGVSDGDKGAPPPPSPLTGCYLLIVVGEPHCNEHKDIILQRVAKGLLSWDVNDCLVDLEKELAIITEQALEGEEARYGERLIQFASENLVTEILIHPVVSTLAQCVRNLLSSFTRHRHIIHAGYTFANNGSWILQDGTFSLADFSEAFQEIEVLRVIRAYENGISLDIHCAPEGDWTRLPKEPFTKSCKVRVNPNDVLTAGSPSISSFINYLEPFLISAELENILESSDVVGNIRFSRPTLYVFPGGQGDAALFGINGFNMLLDGGFSRKACFWDFVRHLDRLDAVLLTRLNNSNVNGISAVLRRKRQNAVYPQIGHFFCNIQERKAILSPDGDKDKDPLLINLLDEGQELVSNLRHLSLTPQVCYRDSEPINLYHKVGHGTLDMYVLSPAKDSKEVREFLQKWNNNDQKLFANQKTNRDFVFPLQNLVSICALLVWQPANPEDTITRILFPGSSSQNKIFEGLDRIKSLEFIKHPVCSEKSLAPTTIIKTKQTMLDKIIQPEKKIPIDNKKERSLKPPADNNMENEMKNGEVNGVQPEKIAPVKKSDSTESEKSVSKVKKIIENGDKIDKPKPKLKPEAKTKPRSDSQQRKIKSAEKKPSPTTPKKSVEKVNGEPKAKPKASPTATPAKSTKDANNRKVVESKIKTAPKKEPPKPILEKKEVKTERKPISRRPKDISKLSGSPAKKVNGVQKPDSISRRGKLDKEGTTDSSTVSTPSADQDSILKKDISKLTSDELQNLKAQELADLKEEQEAVKEIEAVFRKGELHEEKPSDFRKIKDLSIDDKLENEEYLIIEKTEIEQDLVNEANKEEETQKIARDSEESEKQRKLSGEVPSKETEIEEKRQEIQDEVQKIITSATDIAKSKDEVVEVSKEISVTSPEDKIDVSTDKKDNEIEIKEIAQESQPDEKGSANIESGATTTAPTLPEDERMPLDEIKEDNGDQIIEEKHVKEDTKEKDVPVIQLPPKTFENITKLPPVVGIRLDKQSHIRDIVKTPDEVADLPVHEEVDNYDEYPSATEAKTEPEETKKEDKEKVELKEKSVEEMEDKKAEEKADTSVEKKIEEITNVSLEKKEEKIEVDKKLEEAVKEKTDEVKEPLKTEDKEKTELETMKEETKVAEIKEGEKVPIDEQKIEPTKKEADDKLTEKEEKAVTPEDLNKKELSKSPDEEKDTDEHELEMKKEEVKDVTTLPPTQTEIKKSAEDIENKDEKKEKEIKETKEIEKREIKLDETKDISIVEKTEEVEKEKEELSKEDVEKKHDLVPDAEIKDERRESLKELPSGTEKKEEVVEKSETEVKEKDDLQTIDIKEKKDDLGTEQLPEIPKDDIAKESEISVEKDKEQIDEQVKPLKEDVSIIQKIDEKLQKLKEDTDVIVEKEVKRTCEEITQATDEQVKLVKEDVSTIQKIDEKLQKLKEVEDEQVKAVSEIVTHKFEEPQHAEPVVITTDSNPESPGTEDRKIDIEEKMDLGRKSPKEREEDVAKIVASVAEVLKSDAPLEEFEGKIPFTIPYKSYTTELRETHITTVDSPVTDESKTIKSAEEIICPKTSTTYFIEEERKIEPIQEVQESKISKMMKDSNELMQATSKMIHDIKQTQPQTDTVEEESGKEEQDADAGTVHRMLVTTSSEDGGEEIEICPVGTITFSRSSESSGRSSPDLQSQKLSQKSSIADTFSDATVITKSAVKDLQKGLEEASKTMVDLDDAKKESDDIKDTKPMIDESVCNIEKLDEEMDSRSKEIVEQTILEKDSDETKDVSQELEKGKIEIKVELAKDVSSVAAEVSKEETEVSKDIKDTEPETEITDVKDAGKFEEMVAKDTAKATESTERKVEDIKDSTVKKEATETIDDGVKIVEVEAKDTKEVIESAKEQEEDTQETGELKTEEVIKDTDEQKTLLKDDAKEVKDTVIKDVKEITEHVKDTTDKTPKSETETKAPEKVDDEVKDVQEFAIKESIKPTESTKEEIKDFKETAKDVKDVTEVMKEKTEDSKKVTEEVEYKTDIKEESEASKKVAEETKHEADVESIKEEIKDSKEEAKGLKDVTESIKEESEASEKVAEAIKHEIDVESSKKEIKDAKEKAKEVKGIIESIKEETEDSKKTADVVKHETDIESTKKEIKDVKEEEKEVKDIIESTKEESEDSKKLSDGLKYETDVEGTKKEIEDAKKEAKEEKGFIESIKEETEDSKKISDVIKHESDVESIKKEIKDAKEEAKEMKDIIESIKEESEDSKKVSDGLKYETDVEDTKKEIKDTKDTKDVEDVIESIKEESEDSKKIGEEVKHVTDVDESNKEEIKDSKEAIKEVKDVTESIKESDESKKVGEDVKHEPDVVERTKEEIKDSKEDIKDVKTITDAVEVPKEEIKDLKEVTKEVEESTDIIKKAKEKAENSKEVTKEIEDVKEDVKEIKAGTGTENIKEDIGESKVHTKEADAITDATESIKEVSKKKDVQEVLESAKDVIEETKDVKSKPEEATKDTPIEKRTAEDVKDIEKTVTVETAPFAESTKEEPKTEIVTTLSEEAKSILDDIKKIEEFDDTKTVESTKEEIEDFKSPVTVAEDAEKGLQEIKKTVDDMAKRGEKDTIKESAKLQESPKEKAEDVKETGLSKLEEATKDISEKKDSITDDIKVFGDQTKTDTSQKQEEEIMKPKLEETVKELPEEKKSILDSVKDLKETVIKEIEETIEIAKEEIKETKDDAASKIEDVKEDVTQKSFSLGGIVNDIGQYVMKETTKVIDSIQTEVQDIKELTKSKIDEAKEEITMKKDVLLNAVEDLKESVSKETIQAVETVEGKAKEVGDTLETKKEEAKEILTAKKQQLLDTAKDFKESVAKDTDTIIEKAKEEIKDTQDVAESKLENVKETIADQKATLTGVIRDFEGTVKKDITVPIAEAKSEIKDTSAKVKTDIEDVCKKTVDKIDEKLTEIEADMKETKYKVADVTKGVVTESKQILEETKEELIEKSTAEIKEAESKASAAIQNLKSKEDQLKKDIEEETKVLEGKFAEKKETVVEKLDDLSQDISKMGSDLKDTVEDAISEVPFVKTDVKKQEAIKTTEKDVSETQYALHNGLETVEKMVVDVLTADREEVMTKSDADTKTDDQKVIIASVEKTEEEVGKIVEKGVAEVKEFVEETKEAITSIFNPGSYKEDVLEKAAHDIEENFNIVTDMAKSMVFEKCEKAADEDRSKDEKILETSAHGIEEDYKAVTDMAQSIVFEKCEKPESKDQKVEDVLEKSARNIEEDYKTVSDMAESVVFEKCEKHLKEEQKDDKPFEPVTEIKKQPELIEDHKQAKETVKDIVTESEISKETEKSEILSSVPKIEKHEDEKVVKDEVQEVKELMEPVKDTKTVKEEFVKEDHESSKEHSGKTSPEKLEDSVSKISGKSSPALSADIKDLTKEDSGKSTPDIKEVDHIKVDNQDSLLSGKSSPGLSGKSSPILSGTSSPGAQAESKDSLLSGKSSPVLSSEAKAVETLTTEVKDSHSGKSSPDLKGESKDSLLSGTSSPILSSEIKDEKKKVAVDSKDSKSSPIVSGKSSPVLSSDVKEMAQDSEKALPIDQSDVKEIKSSEPETEESGALVDKIEKSDDKESVTDTKIERERQDKEDKETEKLSSTKSSPEDVKSAAKEDVEKSHETVTKEKDQSGIERISDESKIEKDIKVKEYEGVATTIDGGKEDGGKKDDSKEALLGECKLEKDAQDTKTIEKEIVESKEEKTKTETLPLTKEKEAAAHEIKDLHEKMSHIDDKTSEMAKPAAPETETGKKTESEKDKIDPEALRKTSLEVQQATEKKLSVSDVQISIKAPGEESAEKTAEKCSSDLSKSESPEDTKQFDEKFETRDVDSIDSGIGAEVDSKVKKPEEFEKTTSVTEKEAVKFPDSAAKAAEIKEESIAGPSSTSLSPAKTSIEDLHLSGKSTPDIAEVEKMKEIQETLKHEKHIPGSSTPPTVPVSPIIKEISTTQTEDAKTSTPIKTSTVTSVKDSDIRSCTPGSDDYEIGASTYSDISSGQVSRAPHLLESERIESDDDDDVPGSPMSVTSQVAHSRSSSRYDFEDERIGTKMDPMNTSFYGSLPDEAEPDLEFEKAMVEHRQTRGEDLVTSTDDSSSYLYEVTKAKFASSAPDQSNLTGQSQLDQINKNGSSSLMTASFMGDLPSTAEAKKDLFDSWGKPLGLPSPAPPNDNRGTPKKERKLPSNVSAKNKLNEKRAESPSKYRNKKYMPVYVDLTYVPHHGNAYYSYVDFFKRVRARYYVFSGIEPSREVYAALLEAKQTWEDKDLEVTIIPTYDTDILGYWVAENEELLTKYKIDLSPSASRCTINLQDHETSCSAYRLEF